MVGWTDNNLTFKAFKMGAVKGTQLIEIYTKKGFTSFA